MAEELGLDAKMLPAVDQINERQKGILPSLIAKHFGSQLKGKKIAVWGLAFKPRTDDVREAPALVLIDRLLAAGAQVVVHDPEAMENVRADYGDRLTYCERQLDALRGADALAILTEWGEFRHPDLKEMHSLMKTPLVFDGRNIFSLEQMRQAGFTYFSIGRPAVLPK
jgi:UDPglucose 6-dehydrogenase